MSVSVAAPKGVSLKAVALPPEHGAWGFLLEPMLLGLLLAPTGWGLVLGLTLLSAFLLHQPLKITLKDWLKKRRTPRTLYAERFALLYGSAALGGFSLLLMTHSPEFLLPLACALPLMLVQLYFDAGNESRHVLAELAGALALGAIAPALLLLDGQAGGWVLWLVLGLRSLPAILYVRARLRLERQKVAAVGWVWAAHALALLSGLGLVLARATPWVTVLALLLLAGRALWGLSPYRKTVKPAVLGVQELFYGLVTVLLVASGY